MALFYVMQGETYKEEYNGGYVWSPQLNIKGGKNAGYTMMTRIKKGDIIFHHVDVKLVAVSVAKDDCFDAPQPAELKNAKKSVDWQDDGYQVNTMYHVLDKPLSMSNYKKWLVDNYRKESAFKINGEAKVQYMCAIHTDHAVFLLKEAIEQQEANSDVSFFRAILEEISENIDEYDDTEKYEIDELLDNIPDKKPEWTGEKKKQETTTSNSTGCEKPKRDSKIAVNALARADYFCEYDKNDRLFIRKNGKNYTEPHHFIPISKYRDFDYSLDVMENIVSLCSHCHNLLHYGRLEDKKPILRKLYDERIEALKVVGLDLTFEQLVEYYK